MVTRVKKQPKETMTVYCCRSGRFANISEYLDHQLSTPARRRAFLRRIGYVCNTKTGKIIVRSV